MQGKLNTAPQTRAPLQKTGRIGVEKKRGVRLVAQPGGGAVLGNRASKSIAHSLGFAFFRGHAKHPFGRAEHWDGEGEGVLRDGSEVWKMAFIDLLLPARVIQLHELHPMRVLEISDGRIVERGMAILADAKTAEVDGLGQI